MILKSFSRDVGIPSVKVPDFALRHAECLADKAAIIDWPTGRTATYRAHTDSVRFMDLNLTAEAVRFCDELHARLRDTYAGPA